LSKMFEKSIETHILLLSFSSSIQPRIKKMEKQICSNFAFPAPYFSVINYFGENGIGEIRHRHNSSSAQFFIGAILHRRNSSSAQFFIGEIRHQRKKFSAKMESAKFVIGENGIGEIRHRRKWKIPIKIRMDYFIKSVDFRL
jgi:hypothetical protein